MKARIQSMFTSYATSLAFLFTQSQTSFMNHQDKHHKQVLLMKWQPRQPKYNTNKNNHPTEYFVCLELDLFNRKK